MLTPMLTYNILLSPSRVGRVMVNRGVIIATDHATWPLHGMLLLAVLSLCEQRGWFWEQVR